MLTVLLLLFVVNIIKWKGNYSVRREQFLIKQKLWILPKENYLIPMITQVITIIIIRILQRRCSSSRWSFWKSMIHILNPNPMKVLIHKAKMLVNKNLIMFCKIIWIISMNLNETPKNQIKTKIILYLKTMETIKIAMQTMRMQLR